MHSSVKLLKYVFVHILNVLLRKGITMYSNYKVYYMVMDYVAWYKMRLISVGNGES